MWLLAPLLACTASDPATDPTDTGTSPVELTLRERCFPHMQDGAVGADYTLLPDGLELVVPEHCLGTDHQDIGPVGRVVFLGDSITAGTPPTTNDEIYRARLSVMLQERFGADLEIADCSRFGARTDDYLPSQIPECFPDVEDKRTLVISTMGGNDTFAAAQEVLESGDIDAAARVLERAVGYQRDAMWWFRDNEDVMFPNGVSVITGNVYEFTDATGDMGACPLAGGLGFAGVIPEIREEIAVETQTDSVFMLENFCGHGFYSDDPDNECYRGPDAERWFDLTCIHPTPAGHAALAQMFADVVDE
jgi:lysophospholipase L1-like esterase